MKTRAFKFRYLVLLCLLVQSKFCIALFPAKNSSNNLFSRAALAPQVNRRVADKLLVKTYYQGGSSIICQSDLRPGIDGSPRTLKHVLMDKLMVLDAQRLKINVTDVEIDRYLAQIQKEHNLSLADLLRLFDQMGYSAAEGREQLRTMQMIDARLDRVVRSKILNERKELEKYCEEHPKIIPGSYTIAHAFFPYDVGKPKADQQKRLESHIKNGTISSTVVWDKPFELESQYIAADKQFIKDLPEDSVVRLEETAQGVKLLRLVTKKPERVVPLKEREQEIMQILGREKFEKALIVDQKNLLSKAHFYCADEKLKAELAIQ